MANASELAAALRDTFRAYRAANGSITPYEAAMQVGVDAAIRDQVAAAVSAGREPDFYGWAQRLLGED